MLTWNPFNPMTAAPKLFFDAWEYTVDAAQRQILFMDVLRKRGNNYIEHLRNGQPPVLTFHYEMILDGRTFEKPVNFALVRIVDRRHEDGGCREGAERRAGDRRKAPEIPKRPIVIIDPRAGHGPGIGGSKRDSEIGMALDHGHPVYFILFYTEPMPGQTLKHVVAAEERFVEEVVRRHPESGNPAIMGNCQAGWASALLCADRPDIAGPLILNGAPMSYWAGVSGVNPMRYKGGMLGGVWLTSMLCDLGNGKFDGANLVSNFESLNPANTLWSKNYRVYAEIDTEEERFLNFEKWWGGFYLMNAEEIHFIVSNLFVGNKLEQGTLELHEGEPLSLKNIQSPIVVFASKGDNITPPQQALEWIPRVYRSIDEIRGLGQVIVYIIHEDIGHLGIFVAASVAKKEHKEIIRSSEMIDFLPPGLYEMVIEGDVAKGDYTTHFEERTLDDIRALGDSRETEDDFSIVAQVSEFNDRMYRSALSPWVKASTSEFSAEMMRWLHPLRFQRYTISDMNPALRHLGAAAAQARAHRKPAREGNPFSACEKALSGFIEDWLDYYRDCRDRGQEALFRAVYGHEALHYSSIAAGTLKAFAGEKEAELSWEGYETWLRQRWVEDAGKGGLAEGLVRAMIAMARVGGVIGRRHYAVAAEIAKTHKVLRKIRPAVFRRMVKEQYCILAADEERALESLRGLIPGEHDRDEALAMARRIALADGSYREQEKAMLAKIALGLGIDPAEPAENKLLKFTGEKRM
ncbi:MAG: TerB family tellurite resistance protein, partial [Syntrophales bacterium]|nr:TerB family tellurite resistance protein [Syntrophales bacterium]